MDLRNGGGICSALYLQYTTNMDGGSAGNTGAIASACTSPLLRMTPRDGGNAENARSVSSALRQRHTTAMDDGSAGNVGELPVPSLDRAAPPSMVPCGIPSIPGHKNRKLGFRFDSTQKIPKIRCQQNSLALPQSVYEHHPYPMWKPARPTGGTILQATHRLHCK